MGKRRRYLYLAVAACAACGLVTSLAAVWSVSSSPLAVSLLVSLSLVAIWAILAALAVLSFFAVRTGHQSARKTEKALEKVRVDMSRFAYRSQKPAEEAAVYARRASDLLIARPGARRERGATAHVLFVTSNGHGLGHVTRCLAIASAGRGQFRSTILTLSSADLPDPTFATLIRYPSRDQSEPLYIWNLKFQRHLDRVLSDTPYDAVVFDGPSIFPAVISSTLSNDLPLVWICRGLWRDEAPAKVSPWQKECCELIIIPGEEPLIREGDQIPQGLSGVAVPPVIGGLELGFRSRKEARATLGIAPDERAVLISLGAVGARGQEDVLSAAVQAVKGLGEDWRPIVARSPLDSEGRDRFEGELTSYPISPELLAFDAAIIAGGYNSVHEVVAAGVPCVVVPNPISVTDDQKRRARAVEGYGAGIVASTAAGMNTALKRALSDVSPREPTVPGGARIAAREIAAVVRSTESES